MKHDNPPAFPLFLPPSETGDNILPIQHGMTLRDWLAGQALAGDMAAQDDKACGVWPNDTKLEDLAERCALLYRIADAMLVARAKETMS